MMELNIIRDHQKEIFQYEEIAERQKKTEKKKKKEILYLMCMSWTEARYGTEWNKIYTEDRTANDLFE